MGRVARGSMPGSTPRRAPRWARLLGERLAQAGARLHRALAGAEAARAARLASAAQLLGSLGYENVLARGYALARDARGRVIRRAAAIATGGDRLALQFADGTIEAGALGAGTPAPGSTPARRPRAAAALGRRAGRPVCTDDGPR